MNFRESNIKHYNDKEQDTVPLDIINQVIEILYQKLGIDSESICHLSKLQDELNVDSLDFIELITGLESNFNIEINQFEAEKLGPNSTPYDIAKFIYEKASRQHI